MLALSASEPIAVLLAPVVRCARAFLPSAVLPLPASPSGVGVGVGVGLGIGVGVADGIGVGVGVGVGVGLGHPRKQGVGVGVGLPLICEVDERANAAVARAMDNPRVAAATIRVNLKREWMFGFIFLEWE